MTAVILIVRRGERRKALADCHGVTSSYSPALSELHSESRARHVSVLSLAALSLACYL